MRVIKCGFSKTFPYQQYFEKIWLEAELNEGDDERQVLYELKKTAENFFYESKGAAEKQKEGELTEVMPNTYLTKGSTLTTIKTQEETIIEAINSCTELKVLESYALIAKNVKSPAIKDAYDKQMAFLLADKRYLKEGGVIG